MALAFSDARSKRTWVVPADSVRRSEILAGLARTTAAGTGPIRLPAPPEAWIAPLAIRIAAGGPREWARALPGLHGDALAYLALLGGHLGVRALADAAGREALARRDPVSWVARPEIEVPGGPVRADARGRFVAPEARIGPLAVSPGAVLLAAAVRFDSMPERVALATWDARTGRLEVSDPVDAGQWLVAPSHVRFTDRGLPFAVFPDRIATRLSDGSGRFRIGDRTALVGGVAHVAGYHPRGGGTRYAVARADPARPGAPRAVAAAPWPGAPLAPTGVELAPGADPDADIIPLDDGILVPVEGEEGEEEEAAAGGGRRAHRFLRRGRAEPVRVEWPEPPATRVRPVESAAPGAPWLSRGTGILYRARRTPRRIRFERIAAIPGAAGARGAALLADGATLVVADARGALAFHRIPAGDGGGCA